MVCSKQQADNPCCHSDQVQKNHKFVYFQNPNHMLILPEMVQAGWKSSDQLELEGDGQLCPLMLEDSQ